MALPSADQCLRVELDLEALLGGSIDLPGGASIALKITPGAIPDIGDEYMKMLGDASGAIAPLVPLFIVIGAVLAIFDCVKAVPKAIGAPPNPAKVTIAIAKAVDKVNQLLKLVPQLSIPFLVRGLLGSIIAALRGIESKIRAMLTVRSRINAGRALVIPTVNLALLHQNLDCAEANLNLQAAALNAAAEPLNRLICILNLFLDLIGVEGVAALSFAFDSNAVAEAAIAPFEAAIHLLSIIYNAIPLPGPGGDC